MFQTWSFSAACETLVHSKAGTYRPIEFSPVHLISSVYGEDMWFSVDTKQNSWCDCSFWRWKLTSSSKEQVFCSWYTMSKVAKKKLSESGWCRGAVCPDIMFFYEVGRTKTHLSYIECNSLSFGHGFSSIRLIISEIRAKIGGGDHFALSRVHAL